MTWPDVVSILENRLRRWSNIETTSGQVLVFAGWDLRVSTQFGYEPNVEFGVNEGTGEQQLTLHDGPQYSLHHTSTTSSLAQQTRYIEPILSQCWADVVDGGPTLRQHCWFNVLCMLDSILTLKPLSGTIVVFNPFYYTFKSQLLGTKGVLQHQYLQMFCLKLNKHE